MLVVTIKQRISEKWVDQDCPETTTERIARIKEFAGKDAVVKIETTQQKTFLCGDPRSYKTMADSFSNKPNTYVLRDIEDMIRLYEHDPEVFFTTIQCFWNPKHVETVFPEMPTTVVVEGKGWEHMRGKE